MNTTQTIRILQVEDNPGDVVLVRELFADTPGIEFKIEQASRLADALRLLQEQAFDVVLLDLGLPDSQGVDTFVALHQQAPEVPILVLTAQDDETLGLKTIQSGADDFLVKKETQGALLGNSIRYAVARAHARHTQDEQRQREMQAREMDDVERLTAPAGTTITARIYSGSPLRESAPAEFKAAVAEYTDLLGQALEQRMFKTEANCSERLRELSQQLGFLRASPREVVEIHTTALRAKMRDIPSQKAQAYFEEGRLMALELMGYLAGYYRTFYKTAKGKELQS